MNKTVLMKLTPQILKGAELSGIHGTSLCKLLNVSPHGLAELSHGLEDLTPRQGRALEKASGKSVAELSLLGVAANASPAQRNKRADLLQNTLKMLSSSRGQGATRSPSQRAATRPSSTPKKRPSTTRARAA